MKAEIRKAVDAMLAKGEPILVSDGETSYTITQKDVDDIKQACCCDEEEARDRLSQWIDEAVIERIN